MTFRKLIARPAVWVTTALTATVIVGALLLWLHLRPPVSHFQEVRAGVLYRGAQPGGEAMETLAHRFGIRTVINLRGTKPDEGWWSTEKEFCRLHAMNMIDINLADANIEAAGLRQFLAVVTDPNCQPVFVHCEHGSARTGFVSAAYRVAIDGWSSHAALHEAKDLRFNHEVPSNQGFAKIVELLGGGADWRTVESWWPTSRTLARTSLKP